MVDRRLGRGIGGHEGRRSGRLARAHVDHHPATPLIQKDLGLGSGAERGQHQVLVEYVPPVLTVQAGGRTRPPTGHHADVVDGNVEASERGGGLVHHAVHLLVPPAIGHDGVGASALLHDGFDNTLGMLSPDVSDRDRGPGSGQPPGDLGPDACSRSGHQSARIGQVDGDAHVVVLPFSPTGEVAKMAKWRNVELVPALVMTRIPI